jgi:hypothetical protein
MIWLQAAARSLTFSLAATLFTLVLPAQVAPPMYDLYFRADSGVVSVWVESSTGIFRWLDSSQSIEFIGRGSIVFPNLGPMVLTYSGEAPGHDWVVLALKVYGTRATGSLTLFPEGEPVRKLVSLLYDKDTRNDRPPGTRRSRKAIPPPSVSGLQTAPTPEVPRPR